MVEHELKTRAEAFDAIVNGLKTFEVRKNDRFFQSGDIVILKCMDRDTPYWYDSSKKPLRFRIGWMLQGGQFGIEPGYCVFQLEPLP